MTSFREQAIKDVAKALDLEESAVVVYLTCGPPLLIEESAVIYAFYQREATLKLEDALDLLLSHTELRGDAAKLLAVGKARAALNAVKEG